MGYFIQYQRKAARHSMVISSFSLFSTWAFVVFSRVVTSRALALLTLEEYVIQIVVRSSVLM